MRRLLVLLTVTLCATVAHADSFMTSVETGSRRAAKIGPAPYTGSAISASQAKGMLPRATKLALGKNLAVAMDATRVVDSAAMDIPSVGRKFSAALNRAAKDRSPEHRFIAAYNKMNRDPGSARATAQLRSATNVLGADSAAHLGAFQALAQRASFGGVSAEQTTALYKEAAAHLRIAQGIEKRETHRPLVRAGIASAKQYAAYYPELASLLK